MSESQQPQRIFNRHVAPDIGERPPPPAGDANWRRIPDHPDYECNREGVIRRATTGTSTWPGRVLPIRRGRVNLQGKSYSARELVAATWEERANYQGRQPHLDIPPPMPADEPLDNAVLPEGEWRKVVQDPDYVCNRQGVVRRLTPGNGTTPGRVVTGSTRDPNWVMLRGNALSRREIVLAAFGDASEVADMQDGWRKRRQKKAEPAPEPIFPPKVEAPITAARVAMAWRLSYPAGKALEAIERGDLAEAIEYLQMEVAASPDRN